MDDGRFDLVEVAQGADDLHDNGARLLLRHQLVLFQVEVQVVSFAELQNRTEPGDRGRRQTHRHKRGEFNHSVNSICSLTLTLIKRL